MPPNSLQDRAGNRFAGLAHPDFTFCTEPRAPPVVTARYPTNNHINVPVSPINIMIRFDKTLNVYMAPANGFAHVVDWTCLLRLKLLAAAGAGGLLPLSSESYQARGDGSAYLACPSCSSADGSSSCDACCSGGTTAWETCATVTDCVNS